MCIIERPNGSNNENESSITYLTVDQKDTFKTKYVLKMIDLEKLTNLNEFIVCYQKCQTFLIDFLLIIERHIMVQTIKSL